ncbi:MAG: VWA domain-containing protein [Gammaproteobacteria bacterium]|nr:VWA domain-containing protein [Gammaproteobacteria bacterium]MDH5650743.1 VWA domain-containing protein [Gammaproteobacteria bacterium]
MLRTNLINPVITSRYLLTPIIAVLLGSLAACGGPQLARMESSPQLMMLEVSAESPAAFPKQEPEYTPSGETYNHIKENRFQEVLTNPASTFSVDVDTASYSNVRRFINDGKLPIKDAVRIEEMVNYFSYTYPEPVGEHPFSITTEVAPAPWNPKHRLVQIGLKGKSFHQSERPAANLVFLIDVSGSMHSQLHLVKASLTMLTKQLRADDRVAIVVYAGASGMVLAPTSGANQQAILDALHRLQAGGSTAGAAGIELAYQVAMENFRKGGNNRVILATDGDFNVGPTSQGELIELVEKHRRSGVNLSVLGFGRGNYNDATAELLADKGNGSYAYIDSIREAGKVLVEQMMGTLFTIAKDVKIQMQFNPQQVKAYRLIGYENRMLENRDFADDKKDAGEIGAGHTVTAFYEIIPNDHEQSGTDYKYVESRPTSRAASSDELMTIRFRYKQPQGEKSILMEKVVKQAGTGKDQPSENFRFASAVVEYGLVLRNSKYKGNANLKSVIKRAQAARGEDPNGHRSEFVSLVKTTRYIIDSKPQGRRD